MCNIEITLVASNARARSSFTGEEQHKKDFTTANNSSDNLVLENVCVGSGNSSIKWLSLMASHRMFSFRQHTTRSCAGGGMRLLPNNVYTHSQTFLHPDLMIKDVLSDGETVQVELCDKIQLSETYTPIYHPWCIIAFFTSSQEKNGLREQLIQELHEESLIWDQEKLKILAKKQESINKPKILRMKEMLKDQFLDDDEVKNSMQHEWELIIESGVLDSIADTTTEKEKIYQTLQANFASLNHIYKYYSAVNSQGGTHTLEFIEFTKLINDAEILDSSGNNTNMILKFFGSDIASEVKLWQFMVSFLRIAVYKYITLVKKQTRRPSSYFTKKKEEEEKKKANQGTTAESKKDFTNKTESCTTNHGVTTTPGTVPSPSEAFTLLFQNHLKKLYETIVSISSSTASVKDILISDECLLLLHDHVLNLGKVFCRYAQVSLDQQQKNEQHQSGDSISIESVEEYVNAGTMNVKQFSSFASIFPDVSSFTAPTTTTNNNTDDDKDNNNSCNKIIEEKRKYVTMTDLRQVFSVSQNDKNNVMFPSKDKRGYAEKDSCTTATTLSSLYDDDSCDKQVMVFPEFLESLIHLAMLLKEHDESIMTSISKILHKIEGHLLLITTSSTGSRRTSMMKRATNSSSNCNQN